MQTDDYQAPDHPEHRCHLAFLVPLVELGRRLPNQTKGALVLVTVTSLDV